MVSTMVDKVPADINVTILGTFVRSEVFPNSRVTVIQIMVDSKDTI